MQFIAVGTERSETVACLSGVPQGSVLGPILFGMYVSPVGDLIAQHNICYHQYADDLQLYMSLSSEDFNDLSAMKICAVDVSRWFVENALLLNPDKIEAVVGLARANGCHSFTCPKVLTSLGRALTSLNSSICSVWFSIPV